jgi:hypothetical protein
MSPKAWARLTTDVFRGFPAPLLALLLWPIAVPLMLAAREDDGVTPASAVGKGGLLSLHTTTTGGTRAAVVDPMLVMSASDLARAIRAGSTTSVALTRLCLARVEEANPHLNAVVASRAAAALTEAAAADRAVGAGTAPSASRPEGCLWGVPVVVKECFEVAGMPFTAGCLARKGCVGATDGDAVANLKSCGLVIVGVSNTSEACMW